MGPISRWTGFEANLLRSAMRLSLRSYAAYLGVSFGTVTLWNRRGATIEPTPEMQAVLDTALSRASDDVRERFEEALREAGPLPAPERVQSAESEALSGLRASEVLLTVQVDGQLVTLPLDSVAVAARACLAVRQERSADLVASRSGRWPMPTAEHNDERAYELFVRGYGLLGSNDRRQIERAQALLQQAVNRDPRFARAIAARGYTSWRQYFAGWSGRSQALHDALRDVEAALAVDPGSIGAHTTFIRACWDMGWHERALEAGRSIFERHPDSLDACVAFARSLNNAGLAQHALPLLGKVLAVDPTHPAAVKLTVWCRLMIEDYAGAVDSAREHLERTPSDANTRWAVAMAQSRLADTDAIGMVLQGLEADPGDATLWVLLGYLHRRLGDAQAARQAWGRGLDRVPEEENQRTLAWRANLLAAVGDAPAASQCVEALVGTDPHNGYLRYRMAHVLAEIGRRADAVDMLEHAVADGFRSAQLLRQETTLGLESLTHLEGFRPVLDDLDRRVARCARLYAADLPDARDPQHIDGEDEGR